MFNLAWLLFAFPAAGALINLLAGHRLTNKQIGYIGAGAVGASFLVTVGLWITMLGLEAEHRVVTIHLWD